MPAEKKSLMILQSGQTFQILVVEGLVIPLGRL